MLNLKNSGVNQFKKSDLFVADNQDVIFSILELLTVVKIFWDYFEVIENLIIEIYY